MRILSENLANAQSTGDTPGADAYRRKTISFSWELDRSIGASRAKVAKIDSIRRIHHRVRPGQPGR
jgi:flagellar basal-body rod protein FlgC